MLWDYIKLCRPVNCLITFLAVIGSGITSQGSQSVFLNGVISWLEAQNLLLGALAAGLIAAGGYVFNDIYDVEIDKINIPSRPIPSGAISISNARSFALFLFGSGIITCTFTLNLLAIITCLCATYLLYRYSTDLKRNGLSGNLTVAILSFVLFFYGGVLTTQAINAIFPASFAFLLILAREIIKDVEDITGDRRHKCLTLPIRYGVNKSLFLAKCLLGSLALVAIIPYLTGIYSSIVYPLFIGLNDSFILVTLILLSRKNETELIMASTSAKKILKLTMIVGTIGFLTASIIPIF